MEQEDRKEKRWTFQRRVLCSIGVGIYGWMSYSYSGKDWSTVSNGELGFIVGNYAFAGWLIAGWTSQEATAIIAAVASLVKSIRGK